ncbi:MAG TPA: cytochrome bd-I oxidase subunit CydX, partial [Rubrivivax sp.]|nr:cytochrome bd-I oxidase subunit CydX [Rubrivivax sp.]
RQRTHGVLTTPDAITGRTNTMWYFAWMLGVGFAVLLAIMNAMWGENELARTKARRDESQP